jgi:hypothetical protein
LFLTLAGSLAYELDDEEYELTGGLTWTDGT